MSSLNKSKITNFFSSTDSSDQKKSPIDEKKKKKGVKSSSNKEKKANWGKFVKDMFVNLLSALLFMYFGASIIGFSKYYLQKGNSMKGTDVNGPPYNPGPSEKSSRGKRAGFLSPTLTGLDPTTANSKIGGNTRKKKQKGGDIPKGNLKGNLQYIYNMLFGLDKWSFPYKNYFTEEKEDGTLKDIVSWITEGMAYSFASGRKVIEILFTAIGEIIYGSCEGDISNCEPQGIGANLLEIAALILIPFSTIMLTATGILPIVLSLFTFGTLVFNMMMNIEKVSFKIPILDDFVGKTESYILTFIIGLFLLYSWIWMFFVSSGVSFTFGMTFFFQSLLLVLFTFIGPLLQKSTRKNISNIFFKRLSLVGLIVFGFLSVSAFEDLGKTGGWVVTGVTIGFLILTLLSLR